MQSPWLPLNKWRFRNILDILTRIVHNCLFLDNIYSRYPSICSKCIVFVWSLKIWTQWFYFVPFDTCLRQLWDTSMQMVAQSKNGHIAELHVLTSAVLQWWAACARWRGWPGPRSSASPASGSAWASSSLSSSPSRWSRSWRKQVSCISRSDHIEYLETQGWI